EGDEGKSETEPEAREDRRERGREDHLPEEPRAVGAVVASDLKQTRIHGPHAPERADDDLEKRRSGPGEDKGRLAHAQDDQEKRQQRDLRDREDERDEGPDPGADGPRDAQQESEDHAGQGGEREGEPKAREGDEQGAAEITRGKAIDEHPADRRRRREVARRHEREPRGDLPEKEQDGGQRDAHVSGPLRP